MKHAVVEPPTISLLLMMMSYASFMICFGSVSGECGCDPMRMEGDARGDGGKLTVLPLLMRLPGTCCQSSRHDARVDVAHSPPTHTIHDADEARGTLGPRLEEGEGEGVISRLGGLWHGSCVYV